MLDTKLKSGKKEKRDDEKNNGKKNNARRFGICIAGLAAALFIAILPEFDRKARANYEEAGSEGTQSEEFVKGLVQSNYVFYKNVLDKGSAESFTYDELYLEKKLDEAAGIEMSAREQAEVREQLLESAISRNADFLPVNKLQDILEIYASQIERASYGIQESYVEDIGENMDYYVLDKSSETSLKNTMQPIQGLLGGPDADENDMASYYDYYIIMDYDEDGNLQNVAVKGEDADKLLKTVQKIEDGAEGRLLPERGAREAFAFYYSDMDQIEKLMTITQKKPCNVTFIYAMTKEQVKGFQNRGYAGAYLGRNFGDMPLYVSYAQAGVPGVVVLFVLVIFVITILAALYRPKLLAGKSERKMAIELILLFGIILLAGGMEIVLQFVASVGNGYLLDWVNEYFPVSMDMGTEYEVLRTGICFCFFILYFGCWYFCCLEFSDIVYGIKPYMKKRCYLYMIGSKTMGSCKKLYRKLKEEVLDIDLDEDMGSVLRKILFINFCLIATFCLFWFFGIFGLLVYIVALYCFLKKYIHRIQMQYGMLLDATNSMAEGNLDNSFEEDFGIFESYKEELYKVQDGFRKAVDEEVRSQRMRTELITNVSHDLKTPLTAIITYTDLLKEENITPQQRKEYLETLERKSLRLKVLIEDLFEVSKASSGNVKLEPVPVDICHLMRQVYLEYEDKMKEARLHARFIVPEEKVILDLDSQKTYRIFENLYVNIIKYALPDTRVFITAEKRYAEGRRRDGIHIELKNISAQEITGNPQDLSERFVRGDASRNTEGSGLGLAIAKSLTQLQGGQFAIACDADLFKVVIDW